MTADGDRDTDISRADDAEVTAFCAAVGELILWASLIDTQLNKAILGIFALPEHALIEPIVAQLGARPKAELLKKRARLIPNEDWRRAIVKWIEQAERANARRNIVAHHGMRIEAGRIVLHTDQLSKVIGGIENDEGKLKPGAKMGIGNVRDWIALASDAYRAGQTVLANLDRFRAAMAARNGGEER